MPTVIATPNRSSGDAISVITYLLMLERKTYDKYFKPKKSLGQNFLINQGIVQKILLAAELKNSDNILEVGPGKGVLTFEIAERVKCLVAVEKDNGLYAELESRERKTKLSFRPRSHRVEKSVNCHLVDSSTLLRNDRGTLPDSSIPQKTEQVPLRNDMGRLSMPLPTPLKLCRTSRVTQPGDNIKFINDDILKFDLAELKEVFNGEPYKIVANLPYNITSRFLRNFLEAEYQPKEMLLMVQREVAERVCAKAGEMSTLSVSVQFFCEPKILFKVSPGSFSPAPKVDSAVIKFSNIRNNKFEVDQEKFFSIVKAGFSARRKQLRNNLKKLFGKDVDQVIISAGLVPEQRPQELSVDDWVSICHSDVATCSESH